MEHIALVDGRALERLHMLRAAFFLAVLIAGSPAPTQAQVASTRRDSAGITIVESPGAAAATPIGWLVDTLPDVDIGAFLGDGRYEFSSISGVAQLPNGSILVVDPRKADVRIFDGRGVIVGRLGHRQNGPADFASPVLIPALVYDSVLIHDNPLSRLTVLSAEGELVSMRQPEMRLGGARGQPSPLRFLTVSRTLPVGVADTIVRNETTFWLVDLSTMATEIIDMLPGPWLSVLGDQGIRYGGGLPPFAVRPSAAVGRECFFITAGTAPEIRKYDASGRLRGLFRVALHIQPLTREEYEHGIETAIVTRRLFPAEPTARVLRRMPMPDTRAVWENLIVDVEGNLWAQHYQVDASTPSQWTVFAPDGAALGSVRLPARLEVRQIGTDFVLGNWRDADGVNHVGRHRLRKGQ